MQKACIVGYGAIGPVHAHAVKKASHGTIAAVCDINRVRADKGAKQYHCRALYSFEDALCDPETGVIHICTPHYLHVDMACRALAAGKHVVMEKPVAVTRDDLTRLIEAEASAKTKLCIMLQNRRAASIEALHKAIEAEDNAGRLLGVSGIIIWDRDEAYYAQDAWRGHWATEGGSLLCNQAIHIIDLMHVFGGTPKRLRANISTKWLEGVIETEDTADALIEFEDGVRGVFFGANTAPTSSPFMLEVAYENVRFRYADQNLYKITKDRCCEQLASDFISVGGKAVWGSGHQFVIEDFYRYLENDGGSCITLQSALPSSKSLLAMYQSAKSGGEWVNISL